nr:MAG TPA: hypothetical protein [Caudoviricetes sp.]
MNCLTTKSLKLADSGSFSRSRTKFLALFSACEHPVTKPRVTNKISQTGDFITISLIMQRYYFNNT